jgi:hypothetical protein
MVNRDEKHSLVPADTQHAGAISPPLVSSSTRTMADYLSHPFFAIGTVYGYCADGKQQQDGERNGDSAESSHVIRICIDGWECTDYFAAISMLDRSIWIIYNAWDADYWELMDPAEWLDGGDDEQPLPTRGRFKPEWDPHRARLARQPHERRRLMAKVVDDVRTGTRWVLKKRHWCWASRTSRLAVFR